MISIIIQYEQVNNISAKLILLIPIFPENVILKIYPHRNQTREMER